MYQICIWFYVIQKSDRAYDMYMIVVIIVVVVIILIITITIYIHGVWYYDDCC